MELEWQTVKGLANLYGYDAETEMMPLLEANMMLLRDIFAERFGNDAHLWWKYFNGEYRQLREAGRFADRIFLLLDVALCEQHLREAIIAFQREGVDALKRLDKQLGSNIQRFPKRAYFQLGVRRALRGLRAEIAQTLHKYRLTEPEAKSPLLQLVNLQIIDLLVRAGLSNTEAYLQAAKLYIGFGFFPDKNSNFKFDRRFNFLENKRKLDALVEFRADRVKANYNQWHREKGKLRERLSEYGGMVDPETQ